MGGFTKAQNRQAGRSSALDPPARAPAWLAAAMANTPFGRTAQMIRDSPVMQARAAALRAAYGPALDPLPPVQRAAPPQPTGLPGGLKAEVEARSGLAMDDVRVHRDSPEPARLQALATARGTDIHLAPGQEQHLPHEAWHVVQQKQGRVAPTLAVNGVAVNDDAALEREADAMGDKASRRRDFEPATSVADDPEAGFRAPGSIEGASRRRAAAIEFRRDEAFEPASIRPPARSSIGAAPVSQLRPDLVQIAWSVTHLVRKTNNSIFGDGDFRQNEIGRDGELSAGQTLVIDNEKIFVSRRGPNQESPQNRSRDKSRPPSVKWYKVLSVNGRDVADLDLYVREGVFIEQKTKVIDEKSKKIEAKKLEENEHSKSLRSVSVYWVADIVKKSLRGFKYRIGGSFAARVEHHSKRTPKDLDLEFWTYEDAIKAQKKLEQFKDDKKDDKKGDAYPRIEYFLKINEEKGVSITVIAMGTMQEGEQRVPICQIELNNENARQGDNDFKNSPKTRHDEQPRRMRRASLIAGAIERLSYTLFYGDEDAKQDEQFLKHIVSTMKDVPPGDIYKEVISRFNLSMIENPPKVNEESDDSEDDIDDEKSRPPIDHKQRFKIIDSKLRELLGLSKK